MNYPPYFQDIIINGLNNLRNKYPDGIPRPEIQNLVYEALVPPDKRQGKRQQLYEGTGKISNQPSSASAKEATPTKQTQDSQPSVHTPSHDNGENQIRQFLEEYRHNGRPLSAEQKREILERTKQRIKQPEGPNQRELLKVIRQVVEESEG